MIVKPTVNELLKHSENRYELIIATSRRARQIADGDKPMTNVKEDSAVTLAANEIAEGKVIIEREGENVKSQESEEIAEDTKSAGNLEPVEDTENAESVESKQATESKENN